MTGLDIFVALILENPKKLFMKFKDWNRALLPFVLVLCVSLYSHTKSVAQFTYINAGIGYGVMPFDSRPGLYGSGTDIAMLRQLRLHGGIMHRPLRNFAFGLEGSMPLIQGNNFSFASGSFNGWNDSSFGAAARYVPTTLEYTLRQSASIGVFGRAYFTRNLLFFVDVRYNYSVMTEAFEFLRPGRAPEFYSNGDLRYPEVFAEDINISESIGVHIPGLALGCSLPLSDFFTFDAQVGVDLMMMNFDGFFFWVDYDYRMVNSSWYEVMITPLHNKANGNKVLIHFKTGFSYFF
ncbi:MAG: hypothetical protein EA392_14475 [Cryomorphaceae bacterium]|nr:MAG: hypothetical protein EA392_14475 [Cryomorphaceae bacterium]